MKNTSLLIIKLLLVCINLDVLAQVPDTTLAGQYEAVVIKSGSYKIYKNIQKVKIQKLWKNVTDSLKKEKKLASDSKVQLQKSLSKIAALQAEIRELKAANSPLKKLSKLNDSTLLWGTIVLLGFGIGFVIYRSRSALQELNIQHERFEELNKEFREYKGKAAEKERKLARELQDERNLVEELKAKRN